MADIYIKVGDMGHNTDTAKVALKFQLVADKLLKDKAEKVIGATPGFTLDPKGVSDGYTFNAKLVSVVFGNKNGEDTVKCSLTGEVGYWPKDLMLSTSLTGSATGIGSVKDRDVALTIQDAMEITLKQSVLPTLAKHP